MRLRKNLLQRLSLNRRKIVKGQSKLTCRGKMFCPLINVWFNPLVQKNIEKDSVCIYHKEYLLIIIFKDIIGKLP